MSQASGFAAPPPGMVWSDLPPLQMHSSSLWSHRNAPYGANMDPYRPMWAHMDPIGAHMEQIWAHMASI